MRLESVLAVTGGRLLNTPYISGFDSIALTHRRVSRGALYVAWERNEIEAAVAQGAYGIITDLETVATDEEIAWIRVESLSAALPKLLRLWLVENPRKIFFVPTPILEFVKAMYRGHAVLFLEKGNEHKSAQLFSSSPLQTVLCDDPLFIERIGYPPATMESEPVEHTVLAESLFETSIVLEGRYHRRLPLAPCMLSRFLNAVGILKHLSADYTLQHLVHTPSFDPVFVDANGKELPFGSSEHALIFAEATNNCHCFQTVDRARWTERKIFIPTQIKFECDIKMAMHRYDSPEHLLATIRNDFARPGYTLIGGMGRTAFFETLERSVSNGFTTTKGFTFNE